MPDRLTALADLARPPGPGYDVGRKATNLDQPPYDPEHEPDRPVLHQHGGGGGGSIWDMEHWVWPLPPTGPFAFVCEGRPEASPSRGPRSTPCRSSTPPRVP